MRVGSHQTRQFVYTYSCAQICVHIRVQFYFKYQSIAEMGDINVLNFPIRKNL